MGETVKHIIENNNVDYFSLKIALCYLQKNVKREIVLILVCLTFMS